MRWGRLFSSLLSGTPPSPSSPASSQPLWSRPPHDLAHVVVSSRPVGSWPLCAEVSSREPPLPIQFALPVSLVALIPVGTPVSFVISTTAGHRTTSSSRICQNQRKTKSKTKGESYGSSALSRFSPFISSPISSSSSLSLSHPPHNTAVPPSIKPRAAPFLLTEMQNQVSSQSLQTEMLHQLNFTQTIALSFGVSSNHKSIFLPAVNTTDSIPFSSSKIAQQWNPLLIHQRSKPHQSNVPLPHHNSRISIFCFKKSERNGLARLLLPRFFLHCRSASSSPPSSKASNAAGIAFDCIARALPTALLLSFVMCSRMLFKKIRSIQVTFEE